MPNNYTDTNLSNLIINKLTKQQYESLIPDENQLYITDEGIEYDTELSTSSENAVQNKVITTALNLKANNSSVIHTTDYATNNSFGIVKPDNSTITISNGVISVVSGTGADNVYWATYGTTTASQVASAISDNKIVACEYQNTIYLLEIDNTSTPVNNYKFTSIRGNLSLMLTLDASNDTWDNVSFVLQEQLTSGANIKTINNTSILGSGNITIDSLPSQSGNSSKFLTTNGTATSWASLPVATSSTNGLVQPDDITLQTSNGIMSLKQGYYNTESLIPEDITSDNLQGFTVSATSGLSELWFILNKQILPTYPRWQFNSSASESPQSYTILFPGPCSLSSYSVVNYADSNLTGRIVSAWTLEYTTDGGQTWTTCDSVSGIPQIEGYIVVRYITEIFGVNGVRFTATGGGIDGWSSVGTTKFYGKRYYTNTLNSVADKSLSDADNIRTLFLSERISKLPANAEFVSKNQVLQHMTWLGQVSGNLSLICTNYVSQYFIQIADSLTINFWLADCMETDHGFLKSTYTIELLMFMPSVKSITWSSSICWPSGTAPNLSSTGFYWFAFRTRNSGANWIGNLQGRWDNA